MEDMPQEEQPQEAKKGKKLIIIGIVVVLLLIGAVAFGFYTIGDAPDSVSTTPDTSIDDSVDPTVNDDIQAGDIVDDLDPLTGVPFSGTWDFTMNVSSQYLSGGNCPTGSGGGQTPTGSVNVWTADDGSTVLMDIDGQNMLFTNKSTIVPYTYKTAPRQFPVQPAGVGTATMEFVATDADQISGTLNWNNNDGCTGAYPFTMNLTEPELPDNPVYELQAGDWTVEYDDVDSDCDDDVASFPDLPTDMSISPEADLDTGGDTGNYDMTVGDEVVYMEMVGDSGALNSADSVDAGTPGDAAGDVLLDFADDTFDTEFTVFPDSETTATGYVTITGSNGCTYTMSITLTATP